MPKNQKRTPMARTLGQAALLTRLVQHAQLDLIDELIKGEGPTHEFMREATATDDGLRRQVIEHAQARLGKLATSGERDDPARRRPAAPAAARACSSPSRSSSRATTRPPTRPNRGSASNYASTARRACGRPTSSPGDDEMHMVGKMIPVHCTDASRRIDFHLGEFRTGDVEEYNGTRLVQRVSIAGSTGFPTRVVCLLTVLEKDQTGALAKFVARVLDAIETALANEAEDKKPPKWWETVRKAAETVIDWLLGWIARPEILALRVARCSRSSHPRSRRSRTPGPRITGRPRRPSRSSSSAAPSAAASMSSTCCSDGRSDAPRPAALASLRAAPVVEQAPGRQRVRGTW